MKTRIIWTKIHEDKWFRKLNPSLRYLFIYYFTNHRIGHTGIYEVNSEIVAFETGFVEKQLKKANEKFQNDKKVIFYKDWIFVPKSPIYGGYTGAQNKIAFERELRSIPENVISFIKDTLSILYIYPIDTTINHKSKIINHKSKTTGDDFMFDKGTGMFKLKRSYKKTGAKK